MQTETQSTAEIKPQAQSNESKASNRGGKRPGAGRRPNLAKQLLKGFTPATIALAVQDQEIQLLDSITKKLNGPASNAPQDGPQNQIESKPAIDMEPTSVNEQALEMLARSYGLSLAIICGMYSLACCARQGLLGFGLL